MPEFQRNEVWSNVKKQKLIDTILKGWRIPKLYFKVDDSKDPIYECVDGQQRLNAIFEFYEGNITLPEDAKKTYGGTTYKTLSDNYSDQFDDFELQIDEIEDAEDSELEELYLRLQLGTPLNTAEKLKAVRGNLRKYILELSASDFFQKSVGVRDTRFAHFAICSKMFYLTIYSIPGKLREGELEKMLQENRTFSDKSEAAVKVKRILNVLYEVFGNERKLLRNRANVLSIFYFILQFNSLESVSKHTGELRSFFFNFFDSLQKEVEKGSKATNFQLLEYQDAISRNTDSKEAILTRQRILLNYLANYDSKIYSLVHLERSDSEFILKKIASEIADAVTKSNNAYTSVNGEDKFKITPEVFNVERILQKPTSDKTAFGNLVDFIYKLIYEGSGSGIRLNHSEAQIVESIKNIRTDLRHDWKHGSRSRIKNKSKEISKTYEQLVGKTSLNLFDADDFISAQTGLYSNLLKFLQNE